MEFQAQSQAQMQPGEGGVLGSTGPAPNLLPPHLGRAQVQSPLCVCVCVGAVGEGVPEPSGEARAGEVQADSAGGYSFSITSRHWSSWTVVTRATCAFCEILPHWCKMPKRWGLGLALTLTLSLLFSSLSLSFLLCEMRIIIPIVSGNFFNASELQCCSHV